MFLLQNLLALFYFSIVIAEDKLLSVVVVYRHGDRTPEDFYNDPYENITYWPEGFGQLTNQGKQRQYLLGQWLRTRYTPFLPKTYNEKDIYVQSDDIDRTIMSAASNLAGLYPPQDDQIWHANLPWQPIPIHTKTCEEDPVIAMKKTCPKYDELYDDLLQTDYFKELNADNKDLYEYLTEKTGVKFKTLKKLRKLYVTLLIESQRNLTLPDWTAAVFPDRLRPLAEISFASFSYTKTLARLRVGPLFYNIIDFFETVKNSSTDRRMHVYSAHDKNIAELLTALGAFDYHCPPFASSLLFELRKNENYYVNVYYKRDEFLDAIKVEGCLYDCKFEDFKKLLHPVAVDLQTWEKECKK